MAPILRGESVNGGSGNFKAVPRSYVLASDTSSLTLRRPLTKPISLVTRGVTKLPVGTLNLVKNQPVSLTKLSATTASLVKSVAKFDRTMTSLVTSQLTKLGGRHL